MDGLTQASETFRNRFRIVARGMSRSHWAEDAEALAQVGPLNLAAILFAHRHPPSFSSNVMIWNWLSADPKLDSNAG